MLPILYALEAASDLDLAVIEYELRRAGLGDRFLEAVRQRAEAIRTNPALYGEVSPDIRAAPVRRFPYVIYYRIEATQILVIAVRHGHDDPAIWQARA